MSQADKKLLIIVILLAILGYTINFGYNLWQQTRTVHRQAVITVDGDLIEKIRLDDFLGNYSFPLKGSLGVVRVDVEGSRIRIVESPCPEQICVHTSWISKPGQSIVCVPGKIIIRIEGYFPVDGIVR